jgi:hypothetical protein
MAMNLILTTVSAVVSSALLNLGFVQLAEVLDPVSRSTTAAGFSRTAALSCVELCAALPCVDPHGAGF